MAVLNFLEKELQIDLSLNDLQKVTDNTPILANMKPSGKYYMEDLNQVGGVPAVMKYLLSNNMIEGDLLTVTGRTIKQNGGNGTEHGWAGAILMAGGLIKKSAPRLAQSHRYNKPKTFF